MLNVPILCDQKCWCCFHICDVFHPFFYFYFLCIRCYNRISCCKVQLPKYVHVSNCWLCLLSINIFDEHYINPFEVWTVGPGGSPDENGETTIDALVMDGVPICSLAFAFAYCCCCCCCGLVAVVATAATTLAFMFNWSNICLRTLVENNGGRCCCCYEICERWHQSCKISYGAHKTHLACRWAGLDLCNFHGSSRTLKP